MRGWERRRVTTQLCRDRNAAPETGRQSRPPAVCITLSIKTTRQRHTASYFLLNTDQSLQLKVGGVTGDRQNPHRVGVTKTALPALDGNDRAAVLDQIQFQTNSQAVSDAVVHLSTESTSTIVHVRLQKKRHSRPSATGGSQCPWVRGTTQGNKPCAGEAGERSVRYE